MRKLIIEIAEAGDDCPGFDVVDDAGRRCDGLSWDEMLGQVAMLTMPARSLGHGYSMRTVDEWRAHRDDRMKRSDSAQIVEGEI